MEQLTLSPVVSFDRFKRRSAISIGGKVVGYLSHEPTRPSVVKAHFAKRMPGWARDLARREFIGLDAAEKAVEEMARAAIACTAWKLPLE